MEDGWHSKNDPAVPLGGFLLLAYVVSWGLGLPATVDPDWPELLSFLTSFGPLVAALVVGMVGRLVGGEWVWWLRR